jgi:hypothetical protein
VVMLVTCVTCGAMMVFVDVADDMVMLVTSVNNSVNGGVRRRCDACDDWLARWCHGGV